MHRLCAIVLTLGVSVLLGACVSTPRHSEYDAVSARIDAVALIVKPEWEAIGQARLKGEPLDGAYVFDVSAVYFEVVTAGVQIVDAAANHLSRPAEAEQTIASAEKHLGLLLGRSRTKMSQGGSAAAGSPVSSSFAPEKIVAADALRR